MAKTAATYGWLNIYHVGLADFFNIALICQLRSLPPKVSTKSNVRKLPKAVLQYRLSEDPIITQNARS
jgi:hypothetical protein